MKALAPSSALTGLGLFLLLGCSSTPDAPNAPEALQEDMSATSPAPEAEVAEAPAAPVPLLPSPGCGTPGRRVLLKLGVGRDGAPPSCVRAEDFDVRFAPSIPARVTMLGPTNEGYCAVDVLVPEGAETGTVTVTVGDDVFESTSAFRVPCQ